MRLDKDNKKPPSLPIINAVFNGSTVILGVCLTVISLFQITDKRSVYSIDEVFGIVLFLFALAVVVSYLYIRNGLKAIYKQTTDYLFLGAVVLTCIAGIVLIMEL